MDERQFEIQQRTLEQDKDIRRQQALKILYGVRNLLKGSNFELVSAPIKFYSEFTKYDILEVTEFKIMMQSQMQKKKK